MDPDPNPAGPKTYGSYGSGFEKMQDITPASTVNTAEHKFTLFQRFMYCLQCKNDYFWGGKNHHAIL